MYQVLLLLTAETRVKPGICECQKHLCCSLFRILRSQAPADEDISEMHGVTCMREEESMTFSKA